MHLATMNAPVRTAVLNSSRISSVMGPFSYPSPAVQAEQKSTYPAQYSKTQPQRRAASTDSFNNQASLNLRKTSATRPTLLSKSTHNTTTTPSAAPTLVPSFSAAAAATTTVSSPSSVSSVRNASSQSQATTSTQSQTSNSDLAPLDWNSFFQLRASRRRYSLVSSILASLTSTATGVEVIATQNVDALGAQIMGFDPFLVLGLATAACGALGWLVGPVLGNAVWGLVNRKFKGSHAVVCSLSFFFFVFNPFCCILYNVCNDAN